MSVSVIVPTYKRPESLSRCLDALARQDTTPDEIIVVVRQDDEASWTCLQRYGGMAVRPLSIEISPGRPGVVAALNAGIAASRGDFLCLTDDDAEPRADWISRIVATLGADPMIGAVGGRDWIYVDGHLYGGATTLVGTVSWWGRVVGNHHIGIGPQRDVAVLKGVNLAVRGDSVREIGFDDRLRGTSTEHHWELGLCLRLLRIGFRVVYDPAIAVDHHAQPRVEEAREFGPRQIADAAHNETLALLEHLSPAGRAAHLLWSTMIGTRSAPGLIQYLRLAIVGDSAHHRLLGNLRGRRMAVATYMRSPYTGGTAAHSAGEPALRGPDRR